MSVTQASAGPGAGEEYDDLKQYFDDAFETDDVVEQDLTTSWGPGCDPTVKSD